MMLIATAAKTTTKTTASTPRLMSNGPPIFQPSRHDLDNTRMLAFCVPNDHTLPACSHAVRVQLPWLQNSPDQAKSPPSRQGWQAQKPRPFLPTSMLMLGGP